MGDAHRDRILILDFGSQYTPLIARRIREAGVYSEIHPYDRADEALVSFAPKGIVLSGGPESVTLAPEIAAPARVFELGVPVLGICYGMQTMAAKLGGRVAAAEAREFGYAQVRARGRSDLLRDIEDHRSPEGYGLIDVWMSHGDRVESLPPGFRIIASSESSPIADMADKERRLYGLQFHPEVTHTCHGEAHHRALRARDLRHGLELGHGGHHRRDGGPGPGLAVRVLGEVRREDVETLRQAEAIYIQELRAGGLYERVSQAFAVFLPVRSVGATGDARHYAPVIALRAVETVDFMTAHAAALPHELLERVARRSVNEVAGVSRVVYDITGKPPATIEWE